MTANILIFAGSVRSGAFSGQSANVAAKVLALKGASVTRISLDDFPLPLFDQDLETRDGIPQNAVKLARLMSNHDGFVIASPEYNGSVTPLLKNTLDWVSRVKEDKNGSISAYSGKFAAIIGSSPGALGGMRGLEHLRAILRSVGAEVLTAQTAIGGASQAFDDEGALKDERQVGMMDKMCDQLISYIRAKSMLD